MLWQYSNPITQLSIIKKLKLEKDHVYAISVEWYEKWCDFVNVGFTTPDNLVSPSDDVSNTPFVKNLNYNKNPGDDFNDITLSNHSSDDGKLLYIKVYRMFPYSADKSFFANS